MQCGSTDSRMSNTEHSVQLANTSNGELNMVENLHVYLPYPENDLISNPGVENNFSKRFLANTEVPQSIKQ